MAQVLKETHLNPQHFLSYRDTVADPDLQIRGSGHPDPEMQGGGGAASQKFFWFGLKIKGGTGPPWAPPRDPPLDYNLFCYSQPKAIRVLAFCRSMCLKP